MPPQRDGSITSFFPAKNEEKGKSKADNSTINSLNDAPNATPSEHEVKGKGKRTNSSSPPADKKRNTKLSKPDVPKHLSPKDLPTDWLPSTPNTDTTTITLSLTIHQGDLFDSAPANSLLVHACNTQGSWGAGIARAFRDRYPKAYVIYRDFCIKEHNPKTNPIRTGTALLIPPVDVGRKEWIGCLFTSTRYGKAKAKPEAILRNTVPAMQMLLELTRQAEGITEIRMCKINSGLFGVPWEKTQEALESIEVKEGWRANVEVWEP